MSHQDWCGKPCGECEHPCALDESMPCSPDCEILLPDGCRPHYKCLAARCDVLSNDEKCLDASELYEYIIENYNLDGTVCRLVRNIIEYVAAEDFVDAEDAQRHLWSLLDGAFGLEEWEIKYYRYEKDEEEDCEQLGNSKLRAAGTYGAPLQKRP